MKRFATLVSILAILLSIPCFAAADEWDDYIKFRAQYYNLDEQDFNTITCSIESNILSNVLGSLDKQLAPIKDNIEVIKKVDNFSLVYSKTDGLEVNRPELDIIITSEEGLANPENTRKGIQMVKLGFNTIIDGIEMQISGLLQEYITPSRDDFKGLKFTRGKEKTTVFYKSGGSEITVTTTGNTAVIDSVSPSGGMHTNATYEKSADGKLLLGRADTVIKQPAGTVESDTTLTYQKVGKVIFPESITTKVVQEMQSMRQEGQTKLTLTNCRAE